VRKPLRKVHEAIQGLLDNISIADMCDPEETGACASAGESPELVGIGAPARNNFV
jgi:DNA-binding IscR family transcriptional regulator